MNDRTAVKTIVIAAISAATGYIIYTKTGMPQAVLTVFMSAWILFQFRSPEKAWSSLGNFQNPVLFGINSFFTAYIYLAWRKIPHTESLYLSLAAFLLGGVISLLITKYWNMGP